MVPSYLRTAPRKEPYMFHPSRFHASLMSLIVLTVLHEHMCSYLAAVRAVI
jgi:hypothetical protein